MIGIPAVRHSDTGPIKKSPYELLYIDDVAAADANVQGSCWCCRGEMTREDKCTCFVQVIMSAKYFIGLNAVYS